MDKEKAKFILGAYQTGLSTTMVADDPEMSAALEEAQQDHELGQWLREQTEFDERVSAAFREITVPQSLRRSILEGMDVSVQRRAWWRRPLPIWSLGLGGAVIAALVTMLVLAPVHDGGRGGSTIVGIDGDRYEPWQRTALATLDQGFQLELNRGAEPGLNKGLIKGWLMGRGLPIPDSVMAKVGDDQLVGCFAMRNQAGKKASTVCFNSKEGLIHIVSAEVPPMQAGAAPEFGAPPGQPRPGSFGHLNTLSWREGSKAIMLVSNVSQENLLAVIR